MSRDKRTILRYLLLRGRASNRQIARDTGLMYATVCARRNDLQHKDKIVQEVFVLGRIVKEYELGKTGAAVVEIIPALRGAVEAYLKEADMASSDS